MHSFLWRRLIHLTANTKARRLPAKSRYRARLLLETLETRLTPASVSWIGGDFANPTGWSDANNWASAQLPASGDTLVFDNATPGFSAPASFNTSNDFPAGFSVGGIVINDSDSTAGNDFTLAGNAIVLAGGGGIIQSMTGNATSGGTTTISLASIQLQDAEAIANNMLPLGVTGSNLTISSVLDLNGKALTFTANGTISTLTATDTTTTVSGPLSSTIPGTDVLNASGTGLLVLAPTLASTFDGATHVNGGAVLVGAGAALGNTTAITVSSGAALELASTADGINLTGSASLALAGAGPASNGAIESLGGTNSISLPITVFGTVTIGADAGTLTLSGSTLALGSGALIVTGGGNIVIPAAISGTATSGAAASAYVGFTGGDGGTVSQQFINDWSYTSGATSIDYSSGSGGFTATGLTLNGNAFATASIQGTALQLTTGAAAGNEATSAFYTTTVPVSSWSTTFDFSFGSAVLPGADGFTFTVQSVGPTALGANGGALGYGAKPGSPAIAQSYALEFNLYNVNSQLGLGINGSLDTNTNTGVAPPAPGKDLTQYGINFHNNPADNYHVDASLSGSTLTVTLTDTTTTSTTGAVTFTVPTSQFGVLTKSGAGTVTLSGNNTYVGPTQINQGTLVAGASNSLSTTSGINVGSGGALALAAAGGVSLGAAPITIAGAGNGNGAIENLGGVNTIAAPITLSANATLGADAGTLSLTGPSVTLGNFALTATGAGNIAIANQITSAAAAALMDFVGFTGATGAVTATQNILDWTYSASGLTTPIIFPSFPSTATDMALNGNAALGAGGADYLQLTNGCIGQDSSAWWNAAVPVSSFSTSFDFNFVGSTPGADGFTFTIQPQGTAALGAAGSSLGYVGIASPNFALQFNLYNGSSQLGLGVNGTNDTNTTPGPVAPPPPGVDLTTKGINFHTNSTDNYNIAAMYDGSNLATTITDTTTSVSFNTTFTVSLATTTPPALIKNGAGSLTLTGNNTYTSQTTINAGVLVAGSVNALGAAGAAQNGTTVNAGGTLAIQGVTTIAEQQLSLSGTGANNAGAVESLTDGVTLSSTIIPAADASILASTGTFTISGPVSGTGFNIILGGPGTVIDIGMLGLAAGASGGLIKTGAGVLNLTLPGFTNNFNGNTTINGGLLQVTNDAGLGTNLTSTVAINAGTLEVAGATTSTRNLVLGAPSSTIQVDAGKMSDSGTVSGGGALNKTGAGTLALSGITSFSGLTINQGTLALSGSAGLGAGTVTLNGGTLSFQGGVQKYNNPIALNAAASFNADVVWGVSEANPQVGSTRALDGTTTGNVFYEKGVPVSVPSTGLPVYASTLGKFTSSVNGLTTFQLQPYTANNTLLLSSSQSGSMTLTSPSPYQTLAIANSSSGLTTYTIKLNFADGGSTSFTGQVAQDWLTAQSTNPQTSAFPIALGQLGRVSRTTTGLTYSGILNGTLGTAPFIYEQDITLSTSDRTRNLSSITFTNNSTAAATLGVMALSGLPNPAPLGYTNPFVLTASSTVDVSGGAGGTATTVGPLTQTGNNTLTVTGGGGRGLTLGAVTLTDSPTFNVAAGTALSLGALGDGGTAQTINVIGPGGVYVNAAATSLVNGTTVNVTGGTLYLTAAGALGTLAAVNVSAGKALTLINLFGAPVGSAPNTLGSLNGSGTVTLFGNVLTVGSSGNNLSSSFSGSILNGLGTSSVAKAGGGTLTLAAAGTYTYPGATTVSAGKLLLDGSLPTSAVTVSPGATLGGNGTITKPVTASGATLSPGDSPGLLNIGGITLNSASTYVEEIGGTAAGVGGYDQLVVQAAGSVVLNNAALNLSVVNGFQPLPGQSFVIVSYTGTTVTGTFNGLAQNGFLTTNGYKFQISYTGTPAGAASGGHSVVLTVQSPGPASHFAVVASPSSIAAGTVNGVSLSVTALDTQGLVATSYNATNVVLAAPTDPQAVFSSNNVPLTPNGMATFTVTFKTAGNQTITVSAQGLPTAASNPVTVTPGPFTNILVTETAPPAPLPAGQSFIYQIQPADDFGNLLSSNTFNGTVTFATTDPLAPTLPSGTLANTNLGIFLGTLFTAGPQQIMASYTPPSGPVITGTSAPITIVPNHATHFVISAPSVSASAAISSAAESGATVTITTAGAHGFAAGQIVNISGVGAPGYNGAWTITSATTNTFTYSDIQGLASSSGGAATLLAITGAAFSTTVAVKDGFNNTVTGYTGSVALSSTDGAFTVSGLNPYQFTGADAGVHTFNSTLNTSGNQTIRVADSTANIASVSSGITVRGLVVTGITQTSTGFTATFSKSAKLLNGSGNSATPLVNLYDVTLMGTVTNPGYVIVGSLVFSNGNQTVNFVATNLELPDDTYALDLTSSGSGTRPSGAAAGFQDTSGVGLDGGDNAGLADYVATFHTSYSALFAVSVPGFARGPGQPVNVDLTSFRNASSTAGLPVQLTDNNASGSVNVTSVSFSLSYNANWLTISNVTNAASPAGGQYSVATSGAGASATALFNYTNSGGVTVTSGNGPTTIGQFTLAVPSGAAYKSKGLLDLGTPTVLGGSGTVPSVGQSGVEVVAFLGDAFGNGTYSPLDASLMSAYANTGALFSNYPLADPNLVAGVDGAVDPNSTTQVLQFNLNKPVPGIPAYTGAPSNNPAPLGPDPALSIPSSGQWAVGGGQVTVPVNIDDPHPDGSTGLMLATLALAYNPKVFRLTPADIHLGSVPLAGTGWEFTAAVDAVTGQVGITLYSMTPIRAATAGSLVTLDFHVLAGAPAGASPIELVASVKASGQQFQTFLADTQSFLALHQAPTSAFLPGLDGEVLVSPPFTAPTAAVQAAPETPGQLPPASSAEAGDPREIIVAQAAPLSAAAFLAGPSAGSNLVFGVAAAVQSGALALVPASPATQRLATPGLVEQAHRLAAVAEQNGLEGLLWDPTDWMSGLGALQPQGREQDGEVPSPLAQPVSEDDAGAAALEKYFACAGDELE